MYDGSQGVCYTANTRLPNIDFASAHLWPHHWIIDPETSGTTWVADHLRIAKGYIYEPDSGTAPRDPTLNKPFVLGEFGSDKMHQRASYFDKWLDAVENTSNLAGSTVRGDGALVWQVVCDYDLASCRNYAFRLEILYPPASSVSNTLLCHAQIARGTQPDVPC